MRYTVFDVETPNHYNNRISAIGITVLEEEQIASSFFSYVNPEEDFDYFNTQLTGIDESTVADAPTFPELWERIEPFMSSGILVAHNAGFDLGVLKKCLQHYDIEWKRSASYCCTVQMGRRLFPDIKHNLDVMCNHFGICLDHHKADSDARATAEILIRYMRTGTDIGSFVKPYSFETIICPQCGKEMVLRIARKGSNAGKQFYGCLGYPKCRYVRNM
jgi:DNA polymerase-3 subunit epsilon